jgi:tetratricopeptide (TPR) repeat protein
MLSCASHRKDAAGWRCTSCDAGLCPACVAERPVGRSTLEVCMRCGGVAARLREKRSVLQPFRGTLASAVSFPLTRAGFVAIAAAAVTKWVFDFFGAGGIIGGVLYAYYFQVIRHTALGHDDFPGPADFRGFFEDVVQPGRRVLTATIWVWGPGLLWLLFSGHSFLAILRGEVPPEAMRTFAILSAIGTLAVPIILIAAALDTDPKQLVNPLLVIGYPIKLGIDYALCWLFFVTCDLAAGGARDLLERFFARTHLPAQGLFLAAAGLVLAFMKFRALGLLVRARGDDLSYGMAEDYLVPVLAGARPQGQLGPTAEALAAEQYGEAAAAESSGEAADGAPATRAGGSGEVVPLPLSAFGGGSGLELDPDRAYAAPAGVAEAPGELAPQLVGDAPLDLAPESLELAPEPDQTAPQELARLWSQRRIDESIALLEQSGRDIPPLTLSAQGWLELGKACLGKARPQLAILGFRRSAEVAPQGPLAPQAWLLAARAYDEALRDRATSNRVLAELAKRYPESAEGRFAAKRLKAAARA